MRKNQIGYRIALSFIWSILLLIFHRSLYTLEPIWRSYLQCHIFNRRSDSKRACPSVRGNGWRWTQTGVGHKMRKERIKKNEGRKIEKTKDRAEGAFGKIFGRRLCFTFWKITEGNLDLRFAEDQRSKIEVYHSIDGKTISRRFF